MCVDVVVCVMMCVDVMEEVMTSEGRRATADDESLTYEGEWLCVEGMLLINKVIF